MRSALQFKLLCRLYADDVYRYARHLLGNPTDAEDATQEVLLKFWRHLDTIALRKSKAWLLRSTRNHCLDELRKAGRTVLLDDVQLAEQPDLTPNNPRDLAHFCLLREDLEVALQQLPEKLRSVFVLYEINGTRYRDIATTLGIPLNSVKVYLRRARQQLFNHLVNDEKDHTVQQTPTPARAEA